MAESRSRTTGEPFTYRSQLADPATVQALDDLTQPMGRTPLTVAAIVVIDALEATGALGETETPMRVLISTPGAHEPSLIRSIAVRSDCSAPPLPRLLAIPLNLSERAQGGSTAGPLVAQLRAEHIPDPLCSIELNAPEGALVLNRVHENGQKPVLFHAVIEYTRQCLRYLASETSSRWTEPIPATVTNSALERMSPTLRRRWEQRHRQELAAAVSLLVDWLHLDALPPEGEQAHHWWTRLRVDPTMLPLITTWCQWLREYEILAPDHLRLQPGRRFATEPHPRKETWDQPVQDLAATLTTHRALIGRVLTGQAPLTELLMVAKLRPARLAAAEPEMEPVWHHIGEILQEHSNQMNAPLTLADIGGATRDNPFMRTILENAGISSTIVPAGRAQPNPATFDVVLALGALHRWVDPREAAKTVASLLRDGGRLIAVENTELTPLGLLVAGLLENGFTDVDGASTTTPTQNEATWVRLLNEVGLHITSNPVGPTPAVLIQGQPNSDRPLQQVQTESAAASHLIRAGTETEVARIWSTLVHTAPQSRHDNFFELGGDSLSATQFVTAIQKRYGITIALRELFARPHLAPIAAHIDAVISAAENHTLEGGAL